MKPCDVCLRPATVCGRTSPSTEELNQRDAEFKVMLCQIECQLASMNMHLGSIASALEGLERR